MGAGRIWEELCGYYSHKVKKEGEWGVALNSCNCWTQSVTPFCLALRLAGVLERELFRKDHTHSNGVKESHMTIKLSAKTEVFSYDASSQPDKLDEMSNYGHCCKVDSYFFPSNIN